MQKHISSGCVHMDCGEHIHDLKGDADGDGICNLVEYVMGTQSQ